MKKPPKKIPTFLLYGDADLSGSLPRLHIEDIQARSRKYRWEIAAHTHRGLYQCVFLHRGPARVSVEAQSAELCGPAVVLLPPTIPHAFGFDGSSQGFVLTLAAEVLTASGGDQALHGLPQLFARPHIVPLTGQPALADRMHGLLALLLQEFRQPESNGAPICQWLAQSLLWLIGAELQRRHEFVPERQRRQQHLLRFQELLARRYADRWPVARYAHELGLTVRRLNRLALRQSGRSAFGLLQQRLLLEARRRLTYVAMPVSQIAHELGFRDPAYFCRFFRRHTGQSPRRFRSLHS